MTSNIYNEFLKDDKGFYYIDNNKKIYFVRDDIGYYYPGVNGNKVYLLKDNIGHYYQDNKGVRTHILYKTKKETDINTENTNINKLSTYLMKELLSSKYINENTNPHDIRNIIKNGIKNFLNPESSKCKAIISNSNGNYRCNAPTKPGSEYCGRKHKL